MHLAIKESKTSFKMANIRHNHPLRRPVYNTEEHSLEEEDN